MLSLAIRPLFNHLLSVFVCWLAVPVSTEVIPRWSKLYTDFFCSDKYTIVLLKLLLHITTRFALINIVTSSHRHIVHKPLRREIRSSRSEPANTRISRVLHQHSIRLLHLDRIEVVPARGMPIQRVDVAQCRRYAVVLMDSITLSCIHSIARRVRVQSERCIL